MVAYELFQNEPLNDIDIMFVNNSDLDGSVLQKLILCYRNACFSPSTVKGNVQNTKIVPAKRKY